MPYRPLAKRPDGLVFQTVPLDQDILSMKPSEFFARQGHVTFTDDPVALKSLPFIGADCLLWGSDYPHDEGSFPHLQAVIDRTFAELSVTDKYKIVWDNAAKLYGFEESLLQMAGESAQCNGPGRDGLDPENHPKQSKVKPDRKMREAWQLSISVEYSMPCSLYPAALVRL